VTSDASAAASVRRLAAREWQTYRELRLRALAESPDAFRSTLEEEAGYPEARWRERLAADADSGSALPLVGELGRAPVGLAWGRIEPFVPDVAHVYQMWVAPEARGGGIGRMLLDAIVEWARASTARSVSLGVTCGDTPANRLYRAAGFVPVGVAEPLRRGSPKLAQPMTLRLRRLPG
jgi:ribosomal protein S18 acetylase RimI-like enzyme